jgi:hypothetical protein
MARMRRHAWIIAAVTAGASVVAALTGAPALGQSYPGPYPGGYPMPTASPTPSRAAYPSPYPGPRAGHGLRLPAVYRNTAEGAGGYPFPAARTRAPRTSATPRSAR